MQETSFSHPDAKRDRIHLQQVLSHWFLVYIEKDEVTLMAVDAIKCITINHDELTVDIGEPELIVIDLTETELHVSALSYFYQLLGVKNVSV
jgi:hypothetical protein